MRKEKYQAKGPKRKKQKEKICKAKRSEKIDVKFSLKPAKQKRNEYCFASFRLEVKKIWSETGAVYLFSRVQTPHRGTHH